MRKTLAWLMVVLGVIMAGPALYLAIQYFTAFSLGISAFAAWFGAAAAAGFILILSGARSLRRISHGNRLGEG